LRIRAIQEPVFSVANNADFEGGDDDYGHGDCIFLVIYAQPSHNVQKSLRIENGKLEVGHFAIRSGWKTAQDAAGLRLRQLITAVLGQ
jgi:hypothetical protein